MKKSVIKWVLIAFVGLIVVAGAGFAWMANAMRPTVVVGSVLPTASLVTPEGEPFDMTARGDKIVLLDFWVST